VSLTDGENVIRINGKEIKFTYTEGTTTLADIMEAINNSDADVEISYTKNSDKFTVASTQDGEVGDVTFGDEATGELNDIEKLLFGVKDSSGNITSGNDLNGTKVDGQDAKIMVDFDGEGGADPVEVVRGTNTFSLDGLNIAVNGCFGYDSDGNKIDGSDVTFNADVDTDAIVDAVKSMIEDYNKIIKSTNTAVSEKRNLDYEPLTDEQKEDMSDDDIEAWNEKAKAGMLFGDTDVLSLTNDLRFAFLDTGSGVSFEDMGITVSSDYSDNGTVTLDESKLRAMLESDPEGVQEAFTASLDSSTETNSHGGTTSSLATGGIMSRLKTITDKYAKTTGATKGVLLEIAGNSASPLSLLSNTIQTQMDNVNDTISSLQDQLENEQDRYQSQFTQLEQLIQQLNTQSSWLSSFGSSS
jgi:flagellar hook-associated protein 2